MKKILLYLSLSVSTLLYANDFESEYSDKKNDDFFKSYNVFMTSVNDTIYREVFYPISDGYKYVVPETPRDCISNFFDNLMFPIRFINNILQLKFMNSVEEVERFVINTTLGFGGIIDIAYNDLNISAHKEDFGQTLGFYGVPSGEHIVLPILGPSNIRDIVGLTGDYFSNPLSYLNTTESIALNGEKVLNDSPETLEMYVKFTNGAIELYPYLRDSYESYRLKQIEN